MISVLPTWREKCHRVHQSGRSLSSTPRYSLKAESFAPRSDLHEQNLSIPITKMKQQLSEAKPTNTYQHIRRGIKKNRCSLAAALIKAAGSVVECDHVSEDARRNSQRKVPRTTLARGTI